MEVIFSFLILAILLGLIIPSFTFAPWVPCRSRDFKRIFKLANLKPGQVFYDLGCGNGKTVLYAAKHFKVKAVGVELAFPMYFVCKIRQLFARDKNIEFRLANLFTTDISDADVIYVWGMPDTLKKKFSDKMKKEAKKGAKIISYAFKVSDWKPIEVSKPNKKTVSVYLYQL